MARVEQIPGTDFYKEEIWRMLVVHNDRPSIAFRETFRYPHDVLGGGWERTEEEYASLLEASGWRFVACHYPLHASMGVVEAVAV